jgi:tetratricopeptide (TPR) repeat protein
MRRLRAGCLILLCASTILATAVRSQEPEVIVLDPDRPIIQDPGTVRPETVSEATSPPPVGGGDPREILAELWFRHRALVARGAVEEAERQIRSAVDYMKREGIAAAPEVAGAFLAEARRALEEGDYRRARQGFQNATRLDPSAAAAHYGLALARLRGERDLRGAAIEGLRGLRVTLTDPDSLYHLLGNGLLVLYLGLCAGGALATGLLGLRSAPAFSHDLKERARGRVSTETAHLLGWGILALPVLLLLPLAWAMAFWAATLFGYLRRGERVVVAGVLLLLVLAGPTGRLLDWVFGTASDPAARALILAVRGQPGAEQEQLLRRLAEEHPDEPLYPFLLGTVHRAGGRLEEAMAMYRRVLQIDPRNALALVNLGNLQALRQEFAVAQTQYRRALEIEPRLALALYNSHLAHLETFHLESAEEALREARRLDEALVTELLARGQEGQAKRTPVDATYPPGELWTRAVMLRVGPGLRREWVRALGAPATVAGAVGLIAAIVVPGLGVVPRSGGARRCRRCGGAYCRRCQVTSKHPDHCSACLHLFILRDGLAPAIKGRKMEEVVRYRRKVFIGRRIVSLLLPGSGHVIGGRGLFGAAILAAWCVAWIGVLLRGDLLVSPQWLAPATGAAGLVPLLGLALAAWVCGNLTSPEGAAD